MLGQNEDLRDAARKELVSKGRTKPFVRADYDDGTFTLRTQAIDRVDVWVDDAPHSHYFAPNIPQTLESPVRPPGGKVVFRGVKDRKVVSAFHVLRAIPSPAPPPAPAPPAPDPGR